MKVDSSFNFFKFNHLNNKSRIVLYFYLSLTFFTMHKILFLLSFVLALEARAQSYDNAKNYGSLITTTDLKDNLSILASDALEGRETGTRGQKMAAAFIAYHFQELGLVAPVKGSNYQIVELYGEGAPTVILQAGSTTLKQFEDFSYIGSASTSGKTEAALVFVGNGKEADLKQVSVAGKCVVAILEPQASLRNNPVVESLRAGGAKQIFMVVENSGTYALLSSFSKGNDRLSLTKATNAASGIFILTTSAVEKLFNLPLEKLKKATAEMKLAKLKSTPIVYSIVQNSFEIKTENVLGYLEGSDKKDELVVITAHYDHIGKKKSGEGDLINNGADDDGSGTVAVMALAKAFVKAKQEGKGARRSILFMTVTGEEKGLLGSDYYTQHPIFPLSNTVVDLNIDMIGRSDAQHKDSAPYVYAVGSDKLSMDLHTLSESINKATTNLIFDYTYNDQNHPEQIYYRSDHWNFAKNNIPIIFYFDGIHEDYHSVTDEVQKIDFDLLAKRTKCVFYTAWEIANREQRLVVDKK
jgi:hypothetical protein